MKPETKTQEDKFDLINLRLCEIRTIAELLTANENSLEAGAGFLINRLAHEASEALREGLDEVNTEIAALKAQGGALSRAKA